MKITEFKSIVESNKAHNESEIASVLLKKGATLTLINQQLNKTLIELGVKADPKELAKKVKAEVEKAPDINSYKELRLYVDKLAGFFSVMPDKLMPLVRKCMQADEKTIPNKINLGSVKSAVVSYFKGNDKHSLRGLADAILEKTELKEEDALRQARMNYSFAVLLKNNQELEDVN